MTAPDVELRGHHVTAVPPSIACPPTHPNQGDLDPASLEASPNQGTLDLRGHHILCTLHYRGAGYSTAFTENFTALMQEVRARGRTRVRVVALADGVCGACPSLQADGETCQFQDSIMRRDAALLDAMGWGPGDELDLAAAHWAVLARRDELMARVCPGCEWLPRCTEKGPYGMASPLTRPAREEVAP